MERKMNDTSYGTREIEASRNSLEKWNNIWKDDYWIHLEHPEYAALCPRSGYPDTGTIVIDYVPGDVIVELKSFKLFINSFRDRPISHEDATNEIINWLAQEISPKYIRVIGDFMRRGGVKTVITVVRGDGKYQPPAYTANIL